MSRRAARVLPPRLRQDGVVVRAAIVLGALAAVGERAAMADEPRSADGNPPSSAPAAHMAPLTSSATSTDTSPKPPAAIDRRSLRSGVVVGLLFGLGISGASGYPNNSSQIGDSSYYSSSDLLAGGGGALFVGGALADYLNFGFWFTEQSYRSSDWRAKGSGFGFRAEAFPLISLSPALRGLGVFAQFGLGQATLDARVGNYPEAKGSQSIIGIGALYELTLFHALGGHAVLGPTLEYDAIYAAAIQSGAGLLGARLAFYGGM
jgi:hypothetical protein